MAAEKADEHNVPRSRPCALNFERPDLLAVHESPWEQTVAVLYDEGIPDDVSLADCRVRHRDDVHRRVTELGEDRPATREII